MCVVVFVLVVVVVDDCRCYGWWFCFLCAGCRSCGVVVVASAVVGLLFGCLVVVIVDVCCCSCLVLVFFVLFLWLLSCVFVLFVVSHTGTCKGSNDKKKIFLHCVRALVSCPCFLLCVCFLLGFPGFPFFPVFLCFLSILLFFLFGCHAVLHLVLPFSPSGLLAFLSGLPCLCMSILSC